MTKKTILVLNDVTIDMIDEVVFDKTVTNTKIPSSSGVVYKIPRIT